VAGDSGFSRQPVEFDGTHTRQDVGGRRNRLGVRDKCDFT
jgi:hypothetical protein